MNERHEALFMCLLRRDVVLSGGYVPTFQTEGSVSLRNIDKFLGRRDSRRGR